MALSGMRLQNMRHGDESKVAHYSGAFEAHDYAPPYVIDTWKYKENEHRFSLVIISKLSWVKVIQYNAQLWWGIFVSICSIIIIIHLLFSVFLMLLFNTLIQDSWQLQVVQVGVQNGSLLRGTQVLTFWTRFFSLAKNKHNIKQVLWRQLFCTCYAPWGG